MGNNTNYPWYSNTSSSGYPANMSTQKYLIPFPKSKDVLAGVIHNMTHCLDDYKSSAEKFWTFGMLKMEQQIQINDQTQTLEQDDTSTTTVITTCPKSGIVNLVHCFQATRFVPIANTAYKVQEIEIGYAWNSNKGNAITGKLDTNGKAALKLKPGATYAVTFYPDVKQSDIQTLLKSYESVQTQLTQWLQGQWNSRFSAGWTAFEKLSPDEQQKRFEQSQMDGTAKAFTKIWDDLVQALKKIWDTIETVFDLIAHPLKYAEKVKEWALDIDIQKIYTAAKNNLAQGLAIAQDEALLFLFAYAGINWIRMIPPDQWASMTSELIMSILMDIVVGMVLTAGVGLAVKYGARAYSTFKNANLAKALVSELISIAEKVIPSHLPKVSPILQMGEKTLTDAHKVSGSIGKGIDPLEKTNNLAVAARSEKKYTRIADDKPQAKHPSAGKTDSKNAVESGKNTCTNNCPVSMVTGEELLTLEDGALGGVFPFTFQRTYRSSAAETNLGLGYGWSHSLAHRLSFTDGKVFWRDHEGRTIEFPEPSEQIPAIVNPLAKAAIYVGKRPGELILVQPDQPNFHFTRQGEQARLTALSDRYDNRLLIHYNDAGELRRIEMPGVHALTFYFVDGQLFRIDRCVADPDTPERQWQQHVLARYHYNEHKQLIAAENALGEAERYRYNEQHVIQERRLAGGVQFFWEWEFEGKFSRCIRHWSPQSHFDVTYAWDDNGTVTVSNHDGSEEVYQHDDRAKLIAKKDPDGAEIKKAYDDDGNLIAETDALGNTTTYAYDVNGKLEAMIAPDGQITEYDYHNGFVRKITQGDAIWYYQRNEAGDIVEQTTPDNVTTRYRYSPTGQLLAVMYTDGSQHQLVYNRFGQLIEEKDPQGGRQKYRYDALGRMVLNQNAKGAITRYAYDALDRVTDVLLPTGGQRRYSYNAYGKVTSFTNERGQTTRYEYGNQLHLVTAQHNPDGSVLRFAYNNPKLFLSDITNERGEQYQLRYYPNGLVESEIDFAGRKTGYVYDLNGKLIEKQEFSSTDETVLVTRFSRDSMGRLITKTLPDGSAIEYRYDAAGRLVSVSDGNWPLHYDYDAAGRLVAEHQGFATTRYGYNAMGQLDRCKLPDGNLLGYGYFRGELLQGIDLNGNPLSRHDYTDGLETRRQLGILQGLYQYDEQGRLREQKVQLVRPAPNAFKVQRRYHYDALGNLSKLEDSLKGTREFFYDPLERLTQVRGAVEEFFCHDMAGNLLSQFAKNPQATETAGNRLQFQGDRHFEYDGFGNLIAEKRGKGQQLVTRYHYDCQHRLIKLEKYDGTIAHYKYDAFGRRIEKQVSRVQSEPADLNSNVVPLNQTTPAKPATEKTTFLWQANRLIAETNHKEHYRSFVYEPGTYKPLAQLEGKGKTAGVYYYHLDHLGTPQELTNTQGKLVWAVQYRAYGNVVRTIANDIDTPLRFQGQYFDAESGLHYNRHRYYQPETGRFLTPDPIKLAGGLNNYQYVPNPVNWVDPLGLASVSGTCPNNQITYRGDSREPEVIFNDGFQPKGTNTDLENYAATNEPSIYVSTSIDPDVASDFATMYGTRKGNIYSVRSSNGIDVNKTLGSKSPFPEEKEIAIPGGIDSNNILGATPVNSDGSYVGYTVLNPKVYLRCNPK